MLDSSRLGPAPRRRVWRCSECRGQVQADVEALFPGVISLMNACVRRQAEGGFLEVVSRDLTSEETTTGVLSNA
jgi:hypothetical protein